MAILIIGATELEQIAKIVAHAKAHPVPLSTVMQGVVDDSPVLKLEDRNAASARPLSQNVVFPGGYRAAFSIEEQPAGLCAHLSISVMGRAKKGAMPNEFAVKMIAKEFGVPFPADKMWIEEFDPGEFALNLVTLYAPTREGHA